MTARRFTIEEHVRWSHIDRAGIIYYGQFLRFFEIAEMELFRAVGLPYSDIFDRLDIWLPRVQIHFDFRSPLVLDDLVQVSAFIGRFGESSLKMRFEVRKPTKQQAADSAAAEHVLVAEGHVILVCVDRATFKSRPLPAEVVDRLSPFLESESGTT